MHRHNVSDATALPAVLVPRGLRGTRGDRGAAAAQAALGHGEPGPPVRRPRRCPGSRLGSQVKAAGALEVGVGRPRGARGLGAGLRAPAGPGSTWAAPLEEPTPVPTRQTAPHLGPRSRRSSPGLGAASRDRKPATRANAHCLRAQRPRSPRAASRSTGTRAPQASIRLGACPSSHRSPRPPGGPRRGLRGAPTWPEASRPRGWRRHLARVLRHASTPGHMVLTASVTTPAPQSPPRTPGPDMLWGAGSHEGAPEAQGAAAGPARKPPVVPVCRGPGAASRQHLRPRAAHNPWGRKRVGPSWESSPSLGTARVSIGNMNVTDRSRSLKRNLVFDFRHCA